MLINFYNYQIKNHIHIRDLNIKKFENNYGLTYTIRLV